jgi:hypothetical protein
MTSTAATSFDATSFGRRFYLLGDYCRAIRYHLDGVVSGLGIGAAVCATTTVAAVSIFNATLPINSSLHTKAPAEPVAIVLVDNHTTLDDAANFSDLARVAPDPVNAVTFKARWVPATVSVFTSVVPLVPQYPVNPADNMASLQLKPSLAPEGSAELEIAYAPNSTDVAKLTSATASGSAPRITLTPPAKLVPELDDSKSLRPHPAPHEIGRSPVSQPVPQVTAATSPPASIFEKLVSALQATNRSMPQSNFDSRVAVYDISARTVYLPNGERLEAHSGLGDMLDNPRYVSVKDRGPTPPNVYNLTLREQPFHDVQALRLNPVGRDNMFGRDGILAHQYLRGANGESNGCVSIKDYPAFLNAYLKGEVDRLVVVPDLKNTSWRAVSARVPGRRYADNNP